MKIRTALIFFIMVQGVTNVQAHVLTKNISYQHDGVELEGYLAYDDSIKGRVPAVLIVHEWWGLNDYARKRAEQLAAMRYVAFAVDMYGKGKVTEHPKQAAEWMRQTNSKVPSQDFKSSRMNPGRTPLALRPLAIVSAEPLSSNWPIAVQM